MNMTNTMIYSNGYCAGASDGASASTRHTLSLRIFNLSDPGRRGCTSHHRLRQGCAWSTALATVSTDMNAMIDGYRHDVKRTHDRLWGL